jgi:putative hydrolase
VSESGPAEPNDPFRGLPLFGDLAKLLGGQGPVSWDAARQFAQLVASEGAAEPNVDPTERFRWQDLARVADLHVTATLGLDTLTGGRPVEVVPVTRSVWAQRTLDDYRPLLERLAGALNQPPSDAVLDPGATMLHGLFQFLGPTLLGMSAGSTVGHLATRCFGSYDLPIPRRPSNELLVVPANVQKFGDDWSLPADDLRLWVCLQELTSHAVLQVPHVNAALRELLSSFVAAFRPDPGALTERLGAIDPTDPDALGRLQSTLSQPDVLLGAMETDTHRALRPRLDALVAVIVGVVDHTLDRTSANLLGSSGRIAEAVRRRRIDADPSDLFVERLFGLTLTRAAVERGSAFVAGVVERAGSAGVSRLWAGEVALPTPAEVDAPGLWLARLDLDG